MPKLAVVGQPVSHSRSPAMHTAALEELGLAGEWSYEAIELAPQEFETRVHGLAGQGFIGVNVTVPHKLAALAVATSSSPSAAGIGAANTLTFADGAIAAENTDATGIIAALPSGPSRQRGAGARGGRIRPGRSLGPGRRGRRRVGVESDRREGRGARGRARGGGDLARRRRSAGGFDIVVNATTVGLEAANPAPGSGLGADPDRRLADLKALPVHADALSARQVVMDLVYGAVETPLVAAARAAGAEVVDGLEVLVHQGAASLRLWTGMDPPIETMRQAARGR